MLYTFAVLIAIVVSSAMFVMSGTGIMAHADDANILLTSTAQIEGVTISGTPDPPSNTSFGLAAIDMGDLDDDGINDLAVGVPGHDSAASVPGELYILYMNKDGTVKSTKTINNDTPNGPDLNPGDRFGTSIVSIGDLDNNGYQDIAVGASGYYVDVTITGRIFILFMGENESVERTVAIDKDTPNGPKVVLGDRFGASIANVDDLNGDGIPDLAVGAPGISSTEVTGKLFILFMDTTGEPKESKVVDLDEYAELIVGDRFAESLAFMGDLDDDGKPEIAVGSSGTPFVRSTPDGEFINDNTGNAVHILSLESNGSVFKNSIIKYNDDDLDTEIPFTARFGWALANMGDLNGDNIPDLAVGAIGKFSSEVTPGTVYLLFLDSNGGVKDSLDLADSDSFNPNVGDHSGWSVANINDIDGDGVNDMFIGANGSDTMHVVFMNNSENDNFVKSARVITSMVADDLSGLSSDHFGESVANIGDIDGDGVNDMAVGVPGRYTGSAFMGEVYILLLNSDDSVKEVLLEINSETVNGPTLNLSDRFGESIANIGDIDGNGTVDIAVGAPGHFLGSQSSGNLHIILLDYDKDNSTLSISEEFKIDSRTSDILLLQAGDRFGESVASMGTIDGSIAVAVGAPGHSIDRPQFQIATGDVYVILLDYNDSKLTISKVFEINSEIANGPSLDDGDRFGSSVANLDDIDGNGTADIAVGTPGHSVGGAATGDLHIMLLDYNGSTLDILNTFEINSETANGPDIADGDLFGSSVANLGDIDGNGTVDIASGATGHVVISVATGDLYVMLLDYNGSTLDVLNTLEINSETSNGPDLVNGARFGYDVESLGNDGDGTVKFAIGSPADLSASVFIASVSVERPFITTWEPNFAPIPMGNLGMVTIPVGDATGTYTVDWGDGMTTTHSGDASHQYESPGTYSVKISGDFTQIYMGDSNPFNAAQLSSIDQWGSIQWRSMERAFEGAENLEYNATDAPDLTDVTDMSFMFFRAESFDGDLSSWDVSSVTDISYMFAYAPKFNGNVSNWNVSSVTDMSLTFSGAESFNQPLNDWDVSSVTDTHRMFAHAKSFDQPLDTWDVSKVTDMTRMFADTTFNQPLNDWDVSSVTDMERTFNRAESFNQPLDNWDVSNVTNMPFMFLFATSFNQPLNDWDVSNVTDMDSMFAHATSFNQPLNDWDVSNVTDMSYLFTVTPRFNQPLNDWDVSNVTNTHFMFSHSAFNQPLDNWDVSNVTNMHRMFADTRDFNQPLNNWNISSVTDMSAMFTHASAFNQPLDNWDVSNVTDMNRMFYHARAFNQPLDQWDVSGVTDMYSMLRFATAFNQPLNNWDVSNVTDMHAMFLDAESFNQPLDQWNVSNVTDMHSMFSHATSFNQPLNNWDVSNVTDMHAMFLDAESFNQPLDQWNVSNVTDMSQMFADTHDFNQPLDSWDISSVTTMKDIILNARSFDSALPIGTLMVSSYHDANSNGMQDEGELPFPGVEVLMYTSDSLELIVTDQNGTANREGIPITPFRVVVIEQDGYRITTPFMQQDGSLENNSTFYVVDPMPSINYIMNIGFAPVR